MKLNTKGKEKIIKILYDFLKILMFLLIFILIIFIYINKIKISNYEAFVIVSESMKPEIKVGDIIIIKKNAEGNIKEEDIITFEKNSEYITHRVKEIKNQDGKTLYITKGDNNQADDVEEVKYSEIKGVKIAQIPYIGLLIIVLSKQKIFIIVLIVFLLLYRLSLQKDNKKKERIKKKRIVDEKNFKDK